MGDKLSHFQAQFCRWHADVPPDFFSLTVSRNLTSFSFEEGSIRKQNTGGQAHNLVNAP
jgi:hypothetical protein